MEFHFRRARAIQILMEKLQLQEPEAPHSSRQEKQRLELLDLYQFDRWSDPELNEIVRTAAQICGTPVAIITVVDRDRQWFKASHGVELEFLPRAESFCAHALDQPGLCIVFDTTQDVRFKHYAVVQGEEHVRFYAGAPLLTLEGLTLGTLCVVDVVPRNLTDSQQWMLNTLAGQVMQRFERQRRKFEFNLTEEGLLPAGLHHFTLPKLRRYVGTNPYREKLWLLFLSFLAEGVRARQYTHVFVTGDILGPKARPELVDLILPTEPSPQINTQRVWEMFSVRVVVDDRRPDVNDRAVVCVALEGPAAIEQFHLALEPAAALAGD
jgi:hypothetical protein